MGGVRPQVHACPEGMHDTANFVFPKAAKVW